MEVDGVEYCPNCDGTRVRSNMMTDEFVYGVEGTRFPPVRLKARVLVFDCADCHQSWTGEQAEAARQAAVNAHLNSLGVSC